MSVRAGLIATAAVACLSFWSAPLALAAGSELRLPSFEHLQRLATDSVNITIGQGPLISLDASLLAAAARFLDSAQPEDRTVKEIIAGLQGVYVRSYTFDHAFVYPASAMESMRKQLHTACWQSIVSVHKSQEQSGVDIFVCQLQQRTRGLAIIAIEPRELTIVNIVGAIDLEKLHRLEGHFGIPRLPETK
jgi:hypothetical protein